MIDVNTNAAKVVWPYRLETLQDLRALAQSLNMVLDASENISILTRPVTAGSLAAPNAMAVHPMEGADGDSQGRPDKLTFRRYERFAAGGAGLIWFEAIAVVPEGRANPRQLWINDASFLAFKQLIQRTRQAAAASLGKQHRPILIAQLTHSGRYSKPQDVPHPLIPQRDPYRDAKMKLPKDWPVLTDDYLDSLPDAFVRAAELAFEAGFDAVDIKSCHGYLLNEILACHTRPGKYGGSFENRVSLLLNIIDRIREKLGPKRPIVTRLGIYDAIPYPYGWAVDRKNHEIPDLTEPKKLLALLEQRGVPIVNTTIANPYYNPHYGRPFNEPVAGASSQPEHPLIGVSRIIGLTAEVQRCFLRIAMVGTGYSWLRTMLPYVAAAILEKHDATFIGAGRMGLAYPNFPIDLIKHGKLDPNKVCVACSACTQMMRDGTTAGCVVRDNAVYGPIFRRGRMGNRDNLVQLARNCRQCQQALCSAACPAGVDVPGFIGLFLQGDDRGAYEIIRRNNIFAETCAYLCPVEAQCQGHCLEGKLGDAPLPIADIQRYLSAQANKQGWSQLRLPRQVTGRRVAIIGAGPAGSACAATLLEQGRQVTIFDKSHSLCGTVEAAIPDDRSQQSIRREIRAIFKNVPVDRLIFSGGGELSEKLTLDDILALKFDAAFIALGLPQSIRYGRTNLAGLYDALDFLGRCKHSTMDLAGKTVAVIGGGNTAMDAAVTAVEQGASDVYLIYRRSFAEMPACPAERQRAMDRGVHFVILTQQLEYMNDGGSVRGVRVCPTTLDEPDASGRRKPIAVPDSAYTLKVDVIIEAIGQQVPENFQQLLQGVKFSRGLIVTEGGSCRTSRQGVYAGGDIVRGASTVVAAVADGMKAAREINSYLQK